MRGEVGDRQSLLETVVDPLCQACQVRRMAVGRVCRLRRGADALWNDHASSDESCILCPEIPFDEVQAEVHSSSGARARGNVTMIDVQRIHDIDLRELVTKG